MAIIGSVIRRNYTGFRGVDFSNRKDEVNIVHSPDSLNMWKNYKNSKGKCVETRPDIMLTQQFTERIFGHFFYTYNQKNHLIVHSGRNLFDDNRLIYSDMNEHKSKMFAYNKKLYILDGDNYLVYDGSSVQSVEGFIPTTSIGRRPLGGGTTYQDVNLLTGWRKNSFSGDGTSTVYALDVENYDNTSIKVWVDDVLVTNYTTNPTAGTITFNSAPAKPLTDGADNVVIQFRKVVQGYRNRILNCSIVEIFDNRIFVSGNPDYPNKLWHCSLNDPTYFSDLDYYDEGSDDSAIKTLVVGNNAIWAMKEPGLSNTTIYYHNPTIDDEQGKVYPSNHSSISTGCVGAGTNFNDDIVFLSEDGLVGISGDITTEQVVAHRSSLIDSKLLTEVNYKDILLEEWNGYLLLIAGKHVYLADSRAKLTYNSHTEYEWFYWEFDFDIQSTLVKDGVLYLVSDYNIYSLTKQDTKIESYWTTCEDEFNYPQYQKTTNKKGCVIDMEGNKITVSVQTDGNKFEKIDTYTNVKGFVVARIKKKKWKSIQLKFSSDEHFGVFSTTLESYIGSYVKR